MLEAVKNDPSTYELCSDELLNDLDIVLAAIKRQPLICGQSTTKFHLKYGRIVTLQ
jgi:hypothetical protein